VSTVVPMVRYNAGRGSTTSEPRLLLSFSTYIVRITNFLPLTYLRVVFAVRHSILEIAKEIIIYLNLKIRL
jgi:hypothetical protein